MFMIIIQFNIVKSTWDNRSNRSFRKKMVVKFNETAVYEYTRCNYKIKDYE